MSDDKVIYDFDPRALPDRVLRAVGVMAMASAQTESIVGDFIGAVLQIDNAEALALTAHLGGHSKDQIARAIIELNATSPSIVDEVDGILDEINEATKARNFTVHNSMCTHPTTGEVFSVRESARGSIQVKLQPINVEQIEKDALRIYEAGMELMRFMMRHDLKPLERTRPVRVSLDRKPKSRAKRTKASS